LVQGASNLRLDNVQISESDGEVMEVVQRGLYAQAWGASFILHAIAMMLAVFLVSQVKPLPPQEVFHWNVSLIESVPEQRAESGTQTAPPPVPKSPVQRMRSARTPSHAVLETTQTPPLDSVVMEQRQQPLETPKMMEQPSIPSVAQASVTHQQPVVDQNLLKSHETSSLQEVQPMEPLPESIAPSANSVISQEAPSPEPVQQVVGAVQQTPTTRADYSWLIDSLGARLMELKRYPVAARNNGIEGKVLLRAVIRADGQVVEVRVQKSSGYEELDAAAMETMHRASPLHLSHELGRIQIAITIPLVYTLTR
jgi:periplasmic protein TonB